MLTLTEYIKLNEDVDLDYLFESQINEGLLGKLWNGLAKFLGKNAKKAVNAIKQFKQNTKNAYIGSQTFAVRSKDKEIIKYQQEIDAEMAKGVDNGIKKIKEFANEWIKSDKLAKENEPNSCGFYINEYNTLKNFADEKNDNEAKELADKLLNKIKTEFKEVFGKSKKEVENVNDKLEPAIKKEEEAKGKTPEEAKEQPKDKQEASIGVNDEGKAAGVSTQQEVKGVENAVRESNDFLSPLAKEVNMNGEQLVALVTEMIDKAWKINGKDENGNPIKYWNKKIVNQNDIKEGFGDQAVKGLSAILCGIMILNHDNLSKAIIRAINEVGFDKNDIMKLMEKGIPKVKKAKK